MRAVARPPAPLVLAKHGKEWSREYVRKRAEKSNARFDWKKYNGQPVNRTILPKLLAMTQAHCAYCDGYPLDTTSKPTIDHFLPKARYPERSYDWRNLYPACPMCQSEKEVRFDNRVDPGEYRDELLRPDGDGYAFERYFVFNYKSGHIEANPRAEDADRERAAFTIDKFGLNQGSRPQTRLRTL